MNALIVIGTYFALMIGVHSFEIYKNTKAQEVSHDR